MLIFINFITYLNPYVMKQKKIIQLLFILIGSLQLYAQEAVATSGGNAIGSTGSVSYTVGQVAYTTPTGSTGSVAQGVQQPFEIFTLTGAEFTNITVNAVAYPNPAHSTLTIAITNYSLEFMKYQLIDIMGRTIMENSINSTETILNMESLPMATYFLKLVDNNKEIKTFKIIKN